MEQNQIPDMLFMQLVLQNQQIAMMSMGKLKNPMTDKIDRNLEYAKYSIDTLDMLVQKTKGNLSDYEQKFLTEVIRELKLNYVDEVNKDQQTAETKTDGTKAAESEPSGEAEKENNEQQ